MQEKVNINQVIDRFETVFGLKSLKRSVVRLDERFIHIECWYSPDMAYVVAAVVEKTRLITNHAYRMHVSRDSFYTNNELMADADMRTKFNEAKFMMKWKRPSYECVFLSGHLLEQAKDRTKGQLIAKTEEIQDIASGTSGLSRTVLKQIKANRSMVFNHAMRKLSYAADLYDFFWNRPNMQNTYLGIIDYLALEQINLSPGTWVVRFWNTNSECFEEKEIVMKEDCEYEMQDKFHKICENLGCSKYEISSITKLKKQ